MNPIIPMLAITGRPEIRKIRTMLEQYKNVGIDAIMLYPRSGLEIEYMSEEWKIFCENCLEVIEELQMKVWLYDEFNWPSGSCKNTVIREDASYGAKRFVYKNGTVAVEKMREGEEDLVSEPFENDMLNAEAVQCFIRLTHEKYYQWFGKYFGNVIVGIFTDEPSYIYTANGPRVFPFYEGIQEEYQQITTHLLEDDIRDYCEGRMTEHFPGTYRKLLGERFRKIYIGQVAKWCQEHNILLTGHTFLDDSPLLATRVTGDWFQFMENLDVPGVDELPTNFTYVQDRLFSTIENMRYNGKENAMAELFALGPCSMSYTKRRQMLWYAASYGVNHFFIGISHMDAKGNILKPDFFDNFNHYNPDFEGVRLLAKEARVAAEFSNKKVLAKVGIRCPYTAYLEALNKRKDGYVLNSYTEMIDEAVGVQLPWRVLREGEDSTCQFVVDIRQDGIWEECTGQCFATAQEMVVWLSENCEGPKVLYEDGTLVEDVLLKQYEDGTILVIERKEHPDVKRDCVLRVKNADIPFVLEPRGVEVFELDHVSQTHRKQAEEVKLTDVKVTHMDQNIYRCPFLKTNTTSIRLEKSMQVSLFKRSYPDESGVVLLDGKELDFDQGECAELTGCFASLYRKTEVVLEVGEHFIETDMRDYGYFPSVLVGGDFSIVGNCLQERGNFKQSVFGKVKISGTVEIPSNCQKVELAIDACEMYVSVKVNDKYVMNSAFAPHRIEIPKNYCGQRVSVELTFYTTLAPLFGDLQKMNQEGIFTPNWVDVPISTPEMLDVDKWNMRLLVE